MNTAQIIYEQYKVLPKKVREELKALIINEESENTTLTLMEEIEGGLREVIEIRKGKIAALSFENLKKEMQSGK